MVTIMGLALYLADMLRSKTEFKGEVSSHTR